MFDIYLCVDPLGPNPNPQIFLVSIGYTKSENQSVADVECQGTNQWLTVTIYGQH